MSVFVFRAMCGNLVLAYSAGPFVDLARRGKHA